MTKTDLINAVAKATGLNKKESGSAVNAVFEAIENALAKGDKVQLVGFGTFESKERAARVGRNPRANIPVNIPAKRVPVFKPGSTLKSAVANSK